jgi:hypothetical protein
MKKTVVILTLFSTISCSTTPVDPNASAALAALAKDFAYARSLPEGTRPGPSEDVDIDMLVGLRLSTIRGAIGSPDKRDRRFPLECGAPRCVSFTYGQEERPVYAPPLLQPDGLMTVIVDTGGPWLLILGLAEGRVVSAQWRGQR